MVIDLFLNTFLQLNRTLLAFPSSTFQTKMFRYIESKHILTFPNKVVIQGNQYEFQIWGKQNSGLKFKYMAIW